MDYGDILSRALRIVKKHKTLWLFGVLASCGGGGSTGGSGGGGGSGQSSSFNNFGDPNFTPGGDLFQNANIPDEYILFFFAAICFIFIMVIVFYFVGIVGRVALIKGTQQVEAGEESLSIGQLFQDSQPYLLPAIGLNLLIALAAIPVALAIMIVMIPLTLVTLGLALLCALILFIPFILFIRIIVEQANIALIVDDLGVFDALKRGWEVSRDNLGSMAVMGLILIIGAGVLGFILAIPILFIVFPAVMALALDAQNTAQSGLIIAGICLIVYLPVNIFLNGILQSYVHSAWTLTYLQLSGDSLFDADEAIPAAT